VFSNRQLVNVAPKTLRRHDPHQQKKSRILGVFTWSACRDEHRFPPHICAGSMFCAFYASHCIPHQSMRGARGGWPKRLMDADVHTKTASAPRERGASRCVVNTIDANLRLNATIIRLKLHVIHPPHEMASPIAPW
jgi:hypothetical protein